METVSSKDFYISVGLGGLSILNSVNLSSVDINCEVNLIKVSGTQVTILNLSLPFGFWRPV